MGIFDKVTILLEIHPNSLKLTFDYGRKRYHFFLNFRVGRCVDFVVMVLDLNTQGTIGCTPNSVPHGILGDEKTHKYPRAIGRFQRDFS